MKSRAQRKFALGVLIGAVFGCMTLVAGGVIVFLYFLFGGPAEVTRDVFQYEYLIGRTDANIRSGFVVFPDRLLCGVFLKCQYDEETYVAEVTMLKSMTKLKYEDSDRFPFPAYMAIDGAGCSYEYALADDDWQIIYIYTSYVHEDKMAFDKQYLPKDYEDIFVRDYKEYMNTEHTIYLKKTTYGLNGEPDGWVFDYDVDGK